MNDVQLLYGLGVTADFPLHQDRTAPAGTEPDFWVSTLPQVPRRSAELSGRPLIDATIDQTYYVASEQEDGTRTLRFLRTCEFRLSADLSAASFQPFEGAAPGMDAVMTTGALMAFQLYLRGELVLHASAVDIGGSAVAFVGSSGMGKSTMATLMCAAGASVVTDDVLAVELGDEVPRVRLGATDVRLRKGADALAEEFDTSPARRTSADDREVLRLRASHADRLPLAAIVIPNPTRDRADIELMRLAGSRAIFALLRFPRLLGWQDPAVTQRVFSQTADLANQVPVYVATVPWGPPFSSDVAARVREVAQSAGQAITGT